MDVQHLKENNFYFGRRALKNADRQLAPAIVAYQFAVSSFGFGLLCFAVGYFKYAELPDFLKKITKDPPKTTDPALHQYERYFFYALGGVCILLSLIAIVVAAVVYLRYRSIKQKEGPNADGDEENPEPLCQPPAPGSLPEGSYPTQKMSNVDSDGQMVALNDARPGDTSSL